MMLMRRVLIVLMVGLFLISGVDGIAIISSKNIKMDIKSPCYNNASITIFGRGRLDQKQTRYNEDFLIFGHTYETYADNDTSHLIIFSVYGAIQTFLPDSRATFITRVKLYVKRVGNPPSDLIVGIGKFRKGEEWKKTDEWELFDTYVVFPSSKIPTFYRWIEFDFPDVEVDNSCTYYIAVGTTDAKGKYGSREYYSIGYFKGEDLYERGGLGKTQTHGIIDQTKPDFEVFQDSDLAFKIYAKMKNKLVTDLIINNPIVK